MATYSPYNNNVKIIVDCMNHTLLLRHTTSDKVTPLSTYLCMYITQLIVLQFLLKVDENLN